MIPPTAYGSSVPEEKNSAADLLIAFSLQTERLEAELIVYRVPKKKLCTLSCLHDKVHCPKRTDLPAPAFRHPL